MGQHTLPNIGDIIKFSGKWNLSATDLDDSPSGVVISVKIYSTLDSYEMYNDLFVNE